MANFFPRFLKRWAATGVIAEPTENQSDTGFSYLGTNPPTVELFNAIIQQLDEKDGWMYGQLAEVMKDSGLTPNATDMKLLLNALAEKQRPGLIVLDKPAYDRYGNTFVVPPNVRWVRYVCIGGGGGGGGSYGPNGGGSGGGGGGYSEGIVPVEPGQVIPIAVGNYGKGAPAGNPSGATAGGTTNFGAFGSATGGQPGFAGVNAISSQGGAPGIGYSDYLAQPGAGGGAGQLYGTPSSATSFNTGGGLGGGAGFGASGYSQISIGSTGNYGIFPGGGGCGAGMFASPSATASFAGGDGSSGCLRIEWNM